MKKWVNAEGKIISSRIPDYVYVSMQELADSKGMSLSAYIRQILTNGVDRKKGKSENVYVPTPLYNPKIHKAGDKVKIIKGKREIIVTVPDADGNTF